MTKSRILLAICLAGCVPASPDAALIDAAKSAVSRDLKDPSSAQFRDVSVIKQYCVFGEVNSKNSFGAFVGFKKFVFDSKRNKAMIDPATDEPIDIDNLDNGKFQAGLDFTAMALKCADYA